MAIQEDELLDKLIAEREQRKALARQPQQVVMSLEDMQRFVATFQAAEQPKRRSGSGSAFKTIFVIALVLFVVIGGLSLTGMLSMKDVPNGTAEQTRPTSVPRPTSAPQDRGGQGGVVKSESAPTMNSANDPAPEGYTRQPDGSIIKNNTEAQPAPEQPKSDGWGVGGGGETQDWSQPNAEVVPIPQPAPARQEVTVPQPTAAPTAVPIPTQKPTCDPGWSGATCVQAAPGEYVDPDGDGWGEGGGGGGTWGE
jgi:hypothetical protein